MSNDDSNRDQPRPGWVSHKAQGSSWAAERKTPTTGDKIKAAVKRVVKR